MTFLDRHAAASTIAQHIKYHVNHGPVHDDALLLVVTDVVYDVISEHHFLVKTLDHLHKLNYIFDDREVLLAVIQSGVINKETTYTGLYNLLDDNLSTEELLDRVSCTEFLCYDTPRMFENFDTSIAGVGRAFVDKYPHLFATGVKDNQADMLALARAYVNESIDVDMHEYFYAVAAEELQESKRNPRSRFYFPRATEEFLWH